MQANQTQAPQGPSKAPSPIPGLSWGFLRRTAISTLISSSLIALLVAYYGAMDLGARYLLFSIWALAFFATTALIFRNLLFRENRLMGLAAVVAKLGLLGVIYYVLWAWPIPGKGIADAHGIAMLAGLTTPMVVLVLRVLGLAMNQNKQSSSTGNGITKSPTDDARPDRTPRANFQMQS
jgi:hypothetical protein